MCLVDSGQTDINVEHMNSLDLLVYRFLKNVTYVVFKKSLLETLFTCGVDSFADQNRLFSEENGFVV